MNLRKLFRFLFNERGTFTTEATAETTAYSRVASGTYLVAFQKRQHDGTIAIRYLAPMSEATQNTDGGWQEATS